MQPGNIALWIQASWPYTCALPSHSTRYLTPLWSHQIQSALVTMRLVYIKELGRECNLYKPIVVYLGPPPSKIHDRAAAIGHVQSQCQGWVAIERRRRKRKQGWGEEKKLLKRLEEGMAWGGDLWGTFITTLHSPREMRGEGWRGGVGVGWRAHKHSLSPSLPIPGAMRGVVEGFV